MATYSFRCSKCNHLFDESVPMHKYSMVVKGKMKFQCPQCQERMIPNKIINAVPAIYNAKGFYSVDSRKKEDVDTG